MEAQQRAHRIYSLLRLKAVSPLVWCCWVLAYGVLLFMGVQDVFDFRLPDNDDYMRLQQVRDFIAGQAWADTNQRRFASPEGGQMHFSRLPDIIIATLSLIARPFADQQTSERLMFIAYPALMLLGSLAACNLSMRYVDRRAVIPHMLILIMMAPVLAVFIPGRIDHHSLQLLLTAVLLLATLRAQSSPRWSAVTAVIIIAMMAVGMENAPFAAAAAVGVGLPWLMDGERKGLFYFAAALFIAAPVTLFLLNAGGPIFQRYCDSYSSIHMMAALITSAGAIGLIASNAFLDTVLKRIIASAIAGAIALAIVVTAFPQCLAGPFGVLDAGLVQEWRDGLTASRNAAELFEDSKGLFLIFYLSSFIGLGAAIYLRARAADDKRRTWTLVLLFVATGLLTSLWLMRAATFATAIAAIPSAVIIASAYRRVDYASPRSILPFLAIACLVSPISGYMAANFLMESKSDSRLTQDGSAVTGHKKTAQNCHAKYSDFVQLNQLKPGLVLTQIDIGPEVLAFTHHSITAAPYHRNIGGIKASLEFFTASQDVARGKASASEADYIIFCPSSGETRYFSRLYPDSLSVALKNGETPDWLAEVDTGAAPFRFFHILSKHQF